MALLTIAKPWNQQRYPPIDEWTKKNVTHTHYSAIKENKITSSARK
jgi:hypothetical protein